jgi:hypothetical protein
MADQNEKTEYVVLVQADEAGDDGLTVWKEIGKVKASAGGTAKRAGLAQYYPEGGVVVAIPVRSWEPEDLKPKLSFG